MDKQELYEFIKNSDSRFVEVRECPYSIEGLKDWISSKDRYDVFVSAKIYSQRFKECLTVYTSISDELVFDDSVKDWIVGYLLDCLEREERLRVRSNDG